MTGPVLQRHRLVVRFSDCDPLAHVNNAVYLTYLEQARITLWRAQLGGFGRTSATYEYEIVNAVTGTLVAEAKTVQVWIDYEAGRPLALSDSLKGQLSTAVEALAPNR